MGIPTASIGQLLSFEVTDRMTNSDYLLPVDIGPSIVTCRRKLTLRPVQSERQVHLGT